MSFYPTHRTPEGGLAAWDVPDGARQPVTQVDPGLEVQVDESQGAWMRVTFSNGWSAWVDGRLLETLPATTAPPPPPPSPATPDARTLTAHAAGPDSGVTTEWAEQYLAGGEQSETTSQGIDTKALMRYLGVAGGAAVALSSFMGWFAVAGQSTSAFKIPIQYLFASKQKMAELGDKGLKLGLLMLLIGAAGAALAFVPKIAFAQKVAGGLALLIVTDFVKQTMTLLDLFKETGGGAQTPGLISTLGIGVFVALIGGIGLIMAKPLRPQGPMQ